MQPENLKFDTFLTVLFKSSLTQREQQADIVKYVQRLEQTYSEKVLYLQRQVENLNKKLQQERTKNVDRRVERTELESLFLSSVDEAKRRLVHRKLTSELNTQVKGSSSQKKQRNPEELDQALFKLTELAKDKVKIDDFSQNDKANLVEIFVSNEDVWLKMHDIIFPQTQRKRKISSELQGRNYL